MRAAFLTLLGGILALPAIVAAQTDAAPAAPLAAIDAAGIRTHLEYLSHDRLEGRAPGTPGAEAAARYIAAALQRAGAQPVRGSYFQHVPMVGIALLPGATVEVAGRSAVLAPRAGADIVAWSGAPEPRLSASGELVFVGYGVRAPEYRWNDYADADVEGKIVVVLVGDPPASFAEPSLFAGSELTYYGRWTYKIEEAARHGAAGVLLVHDAEAAGYPWDVVRSSWDGELLALETDAPPGAPLRAWISASFAERLLLAGEQRLDRLAARAGRRGFTPVSLGLTLRAELLSRVRRFDSANVVAHIPSRDPARRDEPVIYTAHYDHLGIGRTVDGDSIYNGAYDNASGVAVLLEIAEAFARTAPAPQRPVLFIATTGEEAGLLGASWYVANPLIPLARTAAVINVDGANLWGETDDIGAMGSERSTLGDVVAARARLLGLRIAPEPAPERGYFFRSDQFPFARAGVPTLDIEHGLEFRGRPEGWGAALLDEYDARHYHRPSDELDPGANLAGAVQQARFAYLVGLDVANALTLPHWHRGTPYYRVRAPSQ